MSKHRLCGVIRFGVMAVLVVINVEIFAAEPLDLKTGMVTVTWTFGTNNLDGNPLSDLAGAKVHYGTSSSNYIHVIDVPGGQPGGTCDFSVTGLVEGVVYYLNGTAYNTAGLESDFCQEVVKVAVGGNQAPQVSVGADAVVVFPDQVTLSGLVTDDGLPAGSVIAVAWLQVGGPGVVTFADDKAAETTVSFPNEGTYVLQLTASDGDKSASNRVTVVVQVRPQLKVPVNFREIKR